jgi:hypothetical protein
MRPLIPALCLLLLFSSAPRAEAVIPDPSKCYATSNAGCILITPAGNGPTLASQDLTVTVMVIDPAGYPIPAFPFQDIWLNDDPSGDVIMCNGGNFADANTDANGETTISAAMAGGGSTQTGMRVYVMGMPIATELLPIEVVSPDIFPDLVVNLADLDALATDYQNDVYDFRSDLSCDGEEDLRDIALFALHYGEACP